MKIKNIEASTLYENNNGVRDHFDYKEAMFTNSLFFDYLMANGLKVWKDRSTRDLICLEYNFGSRSYEKEISHLNNLNKSTWKERIGAITRDDIPLLECKEQKRVKISKLYCDAYKNKRKYKAHTKEEIRDITYNDGVYVEYITRDKDGNVKKRERLHYKMLFRSTGKAKKGSCMFIVDRLYKRAKKFLYMGIKLPKKDPMIVEVSAYAPLVASTTVDKIKINPKNILVLEDIDSFFKTKIVSVEIDKNKKCVSKKIDDYTLKNTMFDGQALIDESIFPSWGNGYILLRHHFCKMAAFNSKIQKFFVDYFGDEYHTATVTDMFGNEHFVKDIELITTDNAMKWLKMGTSYNYWCDRVYENNCMFGIVKTAHESKLGDVQKMSYQMVNSLDEAIMRDVSKESVDYIVKLKKDDEAFVDFLRKNYNFSNDYEVLVALYEQDKEFARSEYFRERKKSIIFAYTKNMKTGKIIQDADNLVIVGSPYAMLLYGATGDKDIAVSDNTFSHCEHGIECYSERFDDGKTVAGFRSPFNGRNNMLCLQNHLNPKIKKYFNFGKLVIAVNMINTDFQDRANGSDQDSDSLYVTSQEDIVSHAMFCYEAYPTIVNNIPKEKNKYSNTMSDYANMDNTLASSQLVIGESSNLAQIALTYSYNFPDEKYEDYVCILSVLAQVSIDNAKRKFDVDLVREVRRIKGDMDIKEHGYPSFWRIINPAFTGRVNRKLHCPMNYLFSLNVPRCRHETSTLPMSHFFNQYPIEKTRGRCKKVEALIEKYSLDLFLYNTGQSDNAKEDYLLLRSDFDKLIEDIQKTYISNSYLGLMSWFVARAFQITHGVKVNSNTIKTTIHKNKSLLIKVLYKVNSKNLLKIFAKNG